MPVEQIEHPVPIDIGDRQRAVHLGLGRCDRGGVPRAPIIWLPSLESARPRRVELHLAVGVAVGGHDGVERRGREPLEPRARLVLPDAVVAEHLVRRRGLEDDQVVVAIAVEVGHGDAVRRTRVGGQSGRSRDAPERAVAVVVEQLVRAAPVDQPQVEIAVVVGVEERAIDGIDVGRRRTHRGRDVAPPAGRRLPPDGRRAVAEQRDVEQTVVVDVTPEARCGRRVPRRAGGRR